MPVTDLDPMIAAVIRRCSPAELITCAAEVLAPLGVIGGTVIVAEGGGSATSMATTGVSAAIERQLGSTVVDGRFPAMAALRQSGPRWFRSRAEVALEFPMFTAIPAEWGAYATMPLRVDRQLVGSAAFPFSSPQAFEQLVTIPVQSVAALLARGVEQYDRASSPTALCSTSVFDRMHDGVIVIERTSGRIVQVNEAALSIGGLSRGEVIGHSVEAMTQLLRPVLFDEPRDLGDGCSVARSTITRPDGTERQIECYYSTDTAAPQTTIVMTDVSCRAPRSNGVSLLDDALIEERSRVARDLHDGVVQSVFAISLSLASLALRSPEPARSVIEQSIDSLDEIVTQVRTTVFDLRRRQAVPLSARLRHEVAGTAGVLGFTPVVVLDGPIDELGGVSADYDLSHHLLLALRECLSNTARHAGARNVTVTVRATGGTIGFTAIDDGKGIDPVARHGDGLDNLAARATMLGGACTIDSQPGRGTRVTWLVPVGAHTGGDRDHDVAC